MCASVWYPLAQEWWSSSGALTVRDQSGQQLLVIPIEFLQKGHVSHFGFVERQVASTYVEEGSIYSGDMPVNLDDPVFAGEVVFVRADGSIKPCTPAQGPRSKHKYRPIVEGGSNSTMSDSKRSSANQSKFREAVIARDGLCLLSDALYETCTASHILPQSRPEYYSEVLGYEVRYLFMPSYGLLLRDDLHHAHDRFEIALYPQAEEYIVHVFALSTPELRQYHGKVLPPSRFRGPTDRRPHPELLRFHYRQCVMKYFRGFAFGMSP